MLVEHRCMCRIQARVVRIWCANNNAHHQSILIHIRCSKHLCGEALIFCVLCMSYMASNRRNDTRDQGFLAYYFSNVVTTFLHAHIPPNHLPLPSHAECAEQIDWLYKQRNQIASVTWSHTHTYKHQHMEFDNKNCTVA